MLLHCLQTDQSYKCTSSFTKNRFTGDFFISCRDSERAASIAFTLFTDDGNCKCTSIFSKYRLACEFLFHLETMKVLHLLHLHCLQTDQSYKCTGSFTKYRLTGEFFISCRNSESAASACCRISWLESLSILNKPAEGSQHKVCLTVNTHNIPRGKERHYHQENQEGNQACQYQAHCLKLWSTPPKIVAHKGSAHSCALSRVV